MARRRNGTSGKRPAAPLPVPRSDVAGLEAFLAVARLGTVIRAALYLGRTQPSISARLAALEATWDTRLFRRAARGMILTPAGARLLPLAEVALRELDRLDRVAGVGAAPPDELRLGAGDALGRERLPKALRALLHEHPSLDVQILEGPRARLLEALREGELDVALVVQPTRAAVTSGLDLAPLIESTIDLLAPRGELGRSRGDVHLRSLAGRRLVVLQPESGFRQHLEAAFAACGLTLRSAVEVGNLSLVRRFVSAGLGFGPVPAVAFGTLSGGPPVERRRLLGIAPVVYDRAVRAGVPLPPAAERLLELLGSNRTSSG